MRIAVLGAGAWGTALAISFASRHEVVLWTRDPGACEALARERASPYLGGCPIPASVAIECDLPRAVASADLTIVATATSGLRPVAQQIAKISAQPQLLWACKGFEEHGSLP